MTNIYYKAEMTINVYDQNVKNIYICTYIIRCLKNIFNINGKQGCQVKLWVWAAFLASIFKQRFYLAIFSAEWAGCLISSSGVFF